MQLKAFRIGTQGKGMDIHFYKYLFQRKRYRTKPVCKI